ncbi:MAG: class I SAM-dependent methyltransferase [Bacteroidales bacterium]|nr:class I SAM-dependent methyltransferase [Bacteroidales bacterium]
MKNFEENIENQFEYNRNKNLFQDGILNSLKFSPETLKAIENIHQLSEEAEVLLIDYLTHRAIQKFCNLNQYYSFDTGAYKALRSLYVELFLNLKTGQLPVETIAAHHYENIISWLQQTNPFAEKIYSSKGEELEAVACSEYSPDLQFEILQLDMNQLVEPILDMGCGIKGELVKYLRLKGFVAYGFDRFVEETPDLIKADWFEFPFEEQQWGTIISNLGFTNHFMHHHLRNDGNFIGYAKRYMEILDSLKPGGCFIYAPDLPFIERYLEQEKFQITKHDVGQSEIKSVKVKRLY